MYPQDAAILLRNQTRAELMAALNDYPIEAVSGDYPIWTFILAIGDSLIKQVIHTSYHDHDTRTH